MSRRYVRPNVRNMERLDKLFNRVIKENNFQGEIDMCITKCSKFRRTTACKNKGENVGKCEGEFVFAGCTPCNKERG